MERHTSRQVHLGVARMRIVVEMGEGVGTTTIVEEKSFPTHAIQQSPKDLDLFYHLIFSQNLSKTSKKPFFQ